MEKKSILVYRSGGLGDHIVTFPTIMGLKDRNRDKNIFLAGNTWYFSLLSYDPAFINYISVDNRIYADIFNLDIRNDFFNKFNRIYIFSTLKKEIKSNIPVTIIDSKFGNCEKIKAYQILFNRLFGKKKNINPPEIQLGTKLVKNSKELLLIHPSSGSPLKNIKLSSFIQVAKNLDKHISPLFIFGEADGDIYQEFNHYNCEFNSQFLISSQELLLLISKTKVFLGNDSGVSHLLAACGTPGLAYFRITEPLIWGPENCNNTFLSLRIKDSVEGILSLSEIEKSVNYLWKYL